MHWLKVMAAIAAGMLAVSAQAQSGDAPPPKIPTADFAVQPLFTGPLISPKGDRLLFQFERDGRQMIGVQDVASGKVEAASVPDKSEIAWYRWAGNDRVLISVASVVPYFDDEARMTRLIVMEVATSKLRFLGRRYEGLEGDDVLFVDPEGQWLLLSIQQTIYDYPSVFRVDLVSGDLKQVVRQRSDVWEWFADQKGVVRVGIGLQQNSWSMVYRKTEAEDFRKVIRAKYDDEDAVLDMLRFAYDSDEGYVLSNEKTGRFGVYRYDFAKRELGALVYESPTNDIVDFDLDEDGKTIRAVWYTDDRDRVVWFDEKMKAFQDEIDGALKGRLNWILSRSRDHSIMIVKTGSASDPGSYYFYQPDAGMMKRLGKVNAKLVPRQLAPTRYVKYEARDGLEIPAYLTLPVGREPKGLPLIILPHGGPYFVRDKLEFDAEVQFLANRGYAVLQPNYRGSDSYGEAYFKKGEGQWGRQMQDDLDDGMDWLVKAGTVDARRVCIVGGSYGGYAALWGATRNPERYRCGASFAGVTDLRRHLGYNSRFLSSRYRKEWRQTVQGSSDFDMDTVSPLKQVARLQVPVLLVHGDEDTTVPYRQFTLYAAALKKAGKVHEAHSYKGEGHGFSKPENLKDWLDRLEAFLAKYNPPG